jgi:hypothetical protein
MSERSIINVLNGRVRVSMRQPVPAPCYTMVVSVVVRRTAIREQIVLLEEAGRARLSGRPLRTRVAATGQ